MIIANISCSSIIKTITIIIISSIIIVCLPLLLIILLGGPLRRRGPSGGELLQPRGRARGRGH